MSWTPLWASSASCVTARGCADRDPRDADTRELRYTEDRDARE
ncbi:hypothetical protein ACFPRL_18195 [Pseudoclavibacter helvolus]